MDIKEKINELVEKIKKDPSLVEKFKKDPVATVEGLLGVDLPDEQIGKIVDGIKATDSLDTLVGALGSILGKK